MIPRLYIVDDEAPARTRLKMLLSDIAPDCPHELAGEASDGQAALEGIASIMPDIVLLDVQMPGLSGLELAAQLPQAEAGAPAIIFISAFDDYALKAFDVHAFDYLVKPVRAERLAAAIRRVCSLKGPGASAAPATPARRQHFSVHERDRLLLVPVADVLYLKAELKYVTLRTGTREYLIEESLTSLEEEFEQVFVRVHRNALAARNAIAGVERGGPDDAEGESDRAQEGWQLVLRGVEERLPISRRQWPVVKALLK
ncbi:MAG: response regulator transcription factor [Herminiimonas sp.]|jgi:two-component system response regulator AlgR|nr:response regulator transcription factor [Herminiimonas sp.]